MTLYKGPLIPLQWSNPNTNQHNEHSNSSQDHNHWVGGTLLILLGCVAWSCFYVLQVLSLLFILFYFILIIHYFVSISRPIRFKN